MKSLVGMLGALAVYFCVASVISVACLLVVAKSRGYLAPERVAKMLAVARGESVSESTVANNTAVVKPVLSPTLTEKEQTRSVLERNLELREQALRNERETVTRLRLELDRDIADFKGSKEEYLRNLEITQRKAQSAGRDTIRQLWETVKPKLAKDLMVAMIEKGELSEVAAILRDMPIAKQAKIVAEFKTAEEQVKLDDLLRLLRTPVELQSGAPLLDRAASSDQAALPESR